MCFARLFWILVTSAWLIFMLALFCIHVGNVVITSANLENHASWLVSIVFCICRLEKPFDQDVTCVLLFRTDCKAISCMSFHLIYARLLWTTCILIYSFCICEPHIRIILWLCVIFVSWPSVITGYWPSRRHPTRGGLGSWQDLTKTSPFHQHSSKNPQISSKPTLKSTLFLKSTTSFQN